MIYTCKQTTVNLDTQRWFVCGKWLSGKRRLRESRVGSELGNARFERSGLYIATQWLTGCSLVYIWYINALYFAAIAWSPHRRGLLTTGGGEADQCFNFWNSLTGQSLCQVDTGSQVTNVAWSEDSPELVSFLHIKVVLSFVLQMVFLTTVNILFYIPSR
jgi:hypothetical protein